MKKKRIPSFRSDAEEARFWDTHDATDYEWEVVTEPVFVRPPEGVINLGGPLWRKVVRTAKQGRTTPDELVRRWIGERLARPRRSPRTKRVRAA